MRNKLLYLLALIFSLNGCTLEEEKGLPLPAPSKDGRNVAGVIINDRPFYVRGLLSDNGIFDDTGVKARFGYGVNGLEIIFVKPHYNDGTKTNERIEITLGNFYGIGTYEINGLNNIRYLYQENGGVLKTASSGNFHGQIKITRFHYDKNLVAGLFYGTVSNTEGIWHMKDGRFDAKLNQ